VYAIRHSMGYIPDHVGLYDDDIAYLSGEECETSSYIWNLQELFVVNEWPNKALLITWA